MHYTTLIVALATNAFSHPAISRRATTKPCLEPAPLSEQFTIAFTIDGTLVSANAISSGYNGELLLQAQRLATDSGTPAYVNYSNSNPSSSFNYTSLNFVLPDGVYGGTVGDVGDDYGVSEYVNAEKDYQQFEWLFNNGSVGHKLYAAPNSFFACNGTDRATGEAAVYLSFGDYNFSSSVSSPPSGCAFTSVYQNFNIPGGLSGATS